MDEHKDRTLDLIFDMTDYLMKQGNFEILDQTVKKFGLLISDVDLLIGLSRKALFEKTEQIAKDEGEWEEGLLNGLE